MRYLILFMLLAGLFVFGTNHCGNGCFFGFDGIRGEGPTKTEQRSVSGFHAINSQLPGTIEISISDSYSVAVQAQENILPNIKTEVISGTLQLYCDKNLWSADNLVIRVSGPSFDALALGGSGTMKVKNLLRGDQLDLSVAGSGTIDLPEASVGHLNCEIAGSGDISVGGTAQDARYEISGSGDIHAKQLAVQQAQAEIAGSGTIECQVAQKLRASISGSGDVYYTGSPQVDTDISGSGSVSKK